MIGIGVDLVEIPRFRQVLDRTPTMVERLFTEAEQGYASRFADPTARLAARFAAKEAVMKALGVGLGSMPLRSIEVIRDDATGRPSLVLHGRAGEVARTHGVTEWRLSMSHTDLMAQATAVAL
ncbi:MAG: holo-ACP synthase [Acidimicrobiales bacterium]